MDEKRSAVRRIVQAALGVAEEEPMASSPEYLEYVLVLLRDVPEVTRRKMMGEYLLYMLTTRMTDSDSAIRR